MQILAAHKNNFDFLRILFASLVVYTHCYALMGNIFNDPLYNISGRVFSEIGVCGFFVISGYLIHQSLERSITLFSFIRKRLLRIFPGLIIAVLFAALVIGSFTTTLSLPLYFSHKETWLYIVNNIFLIPKQLTLPGVFTHNPETAVNGSLWTLRYELLFYGLLCLLFGVSRSIKTWLVPITFVCCLSGYFLFKYNVVTLASPIHKFIFYFFTLGNYFAAGAMLSLFSTWLQKKKTILLLISASLFLTSLLFWQEKLEIINIVSFAVMVIVFGLHHFSVLSFNRYIGDISYGTYIYAYPVQQALVVCLQPQQAWQLMLPSFIVSWLLGWLSWHLVEKAFLKKKPQTITAI